ncbi:MAG TPA: hypothetical protein VG711_09745 [Phycisphaerales bacterium]|nr:hypothetical protein [Phycisphaerales bacterium]
MAEQAADTEAQASEPKKKKPTTLIMIGAVVVVEAVLILGAMMMFGGHSNTAEAVSMEHAAATPDDEMIVEVPILDAKLANNKTGVTYIYAVQIYAHVKKKDEERVENDVDQFQNEIKAEITAIWRTAEPQHFQEPKLDNLTRKVSAYLNDRFKPEEGQDPVIQKVVIVMSTGFRIDD